MPGAPSSAAGRGCGARPADRERRAVLVHLRLPFQVLLAPVFLWGWLVAGGGLSPGVVSGFVAFHLFLYPGATAFNSYYDRDRGPVGGLERPPPVPAVLLKVALGVKAAGWLLAAFVNLPFWVAYGVFIALSVAYSHPRVRLKARPFGSLLVVGFGQGALAFLAAWAATRGEIRDALSAEGALGIAAAVLLVLALYPLTQLYQMDEDAARGDRTLAVVWRPRRCFTFALGCTLVGGLAMLALVLRRFGSIDALVVGAGLAVQAIAVVWLARSFDALAILAAYRRVRTVNVLSAGALGGYLLLRLALNSH